MELLEGRAGSGLGSGLHLEAAEGEVELLEGRVGAQPPGEVGGPLGAHVVVVQPQRLEGPVPAHLNGPAAGAAAVAAAGAAWGGAPSARALF